MALAILFITPASLIMSQTISRKNFTISFTIYAIGSLVIYVGSSLFSLLAQLIALWILLPFYSICIFSRLLIPLIPLSNRYTVTVKYHELLIMPILGFQLVKILSSPALCKGTYEQDGCYSLIQVLLSKENLLDTPTAKARGILPSQIQLALTGLLQPE
jgi:hypothetical protein